MSLNSNLDRLVGDRLRAGQPLDDDGGAQAESKMVGKTESVGKVLSDLRPDLRNNEY
jgi:hypothetical protein